MRTLRFLPPLAAAALALSTSTGTPLRAYANITSELPIAHVTVYPQSAVVTRRDSIVLPAGEHRLTLTGLPNPIDAARLRVSVESPGVRVGALEVRQVVTADYVSEPERALRAQLQQLHDRKASVSDEIQTAEVQLKLLESLASTPTGGDSGRVSGQWLSELLTVIGTGGSDARARIRNAQARQREIDSEIDALETELRRVMTNRRSTTHVLATVQTDAAVTAPVSVEYVVADAGWAWMYEARLDSTTRRLDLQRKASVRQGTGEDWRNVALRITTALPRRDVANPRIRPVFVDIARVDMLRSTAEPQERKQDTEEIIVSAAAPRAELRATQFLAEYLIPGRVTIAADREPRVFTVTDHSFDVALTARAVMYADQVPRLEASFKFEDEVPLQSGTMQLYRDGAFVGTWQAPTLRPGEDVRLPFGADESIRIVVHQEPEQSRERGMISRQQVDEFRRRFEVTSHHSNPLTIELVDRMPVTRNAAIKVATLPDSTPPTEARLDGMEGVYLWRLNGAPREMRTVRHHYSIEYPAGERIQMMR
jgi:uncharacterized protein (TIGR02231 family)